MDSSIIAAEGRARIRIVLLALVCLLLLSASAVAQQRTWTDASGSFKIEAELVEVLETDDGLEARLKKPDGQEMVILLSQLQESDAALATDFFNAANNPAEQETPEQMETEVAEDSELDSELKEDRKHAQPEESINTRPLGAPIDIASIKLDNRITSDIKFDPETAISLDREIKRDEKGRPAENPVYTVDVTERDFRLLPAKFVAITDVLRDPSAPVDQKRIAAESLRESWPQGRHPGLLKVLVNVLSHDDKFLRVTALDLLANHDSDQSLIYIFARIDDLSFDVRWRAYEILTQLRDPRVIPELVERLGGVDGTKAASVLQVFGNSSASLVTETWVKADGDESDLLCVCQLLGNIGDQETAEALKVLESHKSLLVRLQAKNSIKLIRARLEQTASNATQPR